MMRGNLITGVLLLVFSVIFWLGADAIPKSRLGGSVGADGLPKMLAIALGVLSFGYIVQTLLTARMAGPIIGPRREPKTVDYTRHLRAIGMIVIGAVYVAIVPYLGYIPSIALLLLIVALYNGKHPSRGLLLFAVLGAIGFYLLFVRLLEVPLPAGIWPSLIG
jgi:putative tricarboxylic transport membrane protein